MDCPHCEGTGILELPKDIGGKLKYYRDLKGYSLRFVEARTGVSKANMSQIETGKIKSPAFDMVIRLANFYEINPLELIKGNEDARGT